MIAAQSARPATIGRETGANRRRSPTGIPALVRADHHAAVEPGGVQHQPLAQAAPRNDLWDRLTGREAS